MKLIINCLMALLLCNHTVSLAAQKCPDGETESSIQSKVLSLDSTNFLTYVSGAASVSVARAALLDQYKACLKKLDTVEANRKFAGLNWGLGLAFMSISGKSIDEAKVIDNAVRVTKEHKRSAALLLETHYFLQEKKWGADVGWGPFAAIRLADTEGAEVGAFGIGIMMGFKDGPNDGGSWNIGLGYFVDTEVNQLGSGIVEGNALPGTETSIRYKEVDESGWLIMLSSTF